jgi:hypothetical protein
MRIQTYAEFWRFYLAEHSHVWNRRLHLIGTLLAIVVIIAGIVSQKWILIPVGYGIGYAFSWTGHFFVEKNKPATLGYPFWSYISDHRMCLLMLFRRPLK